MRGVAPRVVVTLQAPTVAADPELARRKNARYLEALERAGATAQVLDETSSPADRATAFADMAGLLLTGGADIDPARYGEPIDGSVALEPERDELEWAAWQAAMARRLPILGICRGFQAINVFAGGRLVQHLDGHGSPGYLAGPANRHPLRLVPASRLARILRPTAPRGVLSVNTYHHQGVRPADLAPGLTLAAVSPSPDGELVEAFESTDPDRFVMGVQCHPERTESTPPELERLWNVFVDACRGSVRPAGG